MRVYIPATFSMLEALKEDELFHARGGWGFAVTESLRDFFTEGDDEELADVAFDEAARASLRLLDAAEEKFPHRRVVISVDVEAEPQSDMGDAVDKADLGDEDAELTVGDALEIPLAWYDVAELGMVVDFL